MGNFKHKTQVRKPNALEEKPHFSTCLQQLKVSFATIFELMLTFFMMRREFSMYHVLLGKEFAIEAKFQMLSHFREHIFYFPTFILNAM
jgi:hypothetical protein